MRQYSGQIFHNWNREYKEKCAYLSYDYERVDYRTFYMDIFSSNDSLEKGYKKGGAHPIITAFSRFRADGSMICKNIPVYENMQSLDYSVPDNQFALVGMCTYFGHKSPSAVYARDCHGFCIDLDEVTKKNLEYLIGMIFGSEEIPVPQYIAVSGAGVHLYYVFEEPIPINRHNVAVLENLKKGLTDLIWNRNTSSTLDGCKNKDQERKLTQYQNIFQRFRAIDSKSKLARKTKPTNKSKYVVQGFRITPVKTSPESLARYISPEPLPELVGRLTLEDARKMYPFWYKNKIRKTHRGKTASGKNRGVYNWWLDSMKKAAREGNREICLTILFACAYKARVSFEEVYNDAVNMLPWLNSMTTRPGNRLSLSDVKSAAKFYNRKSIFMSNKYIYKVTGVKPVPKTKRNGRTRSEHAKWSVSIVKHFNGGRPKKSSKERVRVIEWRQKHPDRGKSQCARELEIARSTVYRWWNEAFGALAEDVNSSDETCCDAEQNSCCGVCHGNNLYMGSVSQLMAYCVKYVRLMSLPDDLRPASVETGAVFEGS